MPTPITIETLEVQGFRAYLQHQSFSLRRGNRPLSLAIFAPNAKGKSSLVDAFEYFFSEEATLDRLGRRASQTQAGPHALAHVQATENEIEPLVGFTFRNGSEQVSDQRLISDGKQLPNSAQLIREAVAVPFIIHGYELRNFVEETAENRYKEMVSWFSFQPLLDVQRSLRLLTRDIKAKLDSNSEIDERHKDIQRLTSKQVMIWDESAICDWFNSQILTALDSNLTIAEISEADSTFPILVKKKAEEDDRIGLSTLNSLLFQIDQIFESNSGDEGTKRGYLPIFETSLTDYKSALENESVERDKASQSVFRDIWTSAEKILNDSAIPLEACPVCETEFSSTPHNSRESLGASINLRLDDLASYNQARAKADTARENLQKAKQSLSTSLSGLKTGLIDAGFSDEMEPTTTYLDTLNQWDPDATALESQGLAISMKGIHEHLSEAKRKLTEEQGESTYANALQKFNELVRVKGDVCRINRTKEELGKLYDELRVQSGYVESEINRHIQELLSKLEKEVNALYKQIQGSSQQDVAVIRLVLSEEGAANQQQLRLSIDYSDNRSNVAPSGYLSDSQIHTVALSLRLAAIRRFNAAAPIVVLDDIVTSYDADHRKTIASTLAEDLGDFQIILVTHDEQFFCLLKDHLPEADWLFRRITHLESNYGPVFSDHKTTDDTIEDKIRKGEPAGELIRMAEEEWLLSMCRDFVVDVPIRPIERAFQYDRSELASALSRFLKDRKLEPPKSPGITNPFLNSLRQGTVENLASHFSDNPNKSGSVGDEKKRWAEFKVFRDSFVCPKCGRTRFKRPTGMSRPVCSREGCEEQFVFRVWDQSENES